MSLHWTAHYSPLNKFDSNLSEVFSIMKTDPVRVLNQLLMAQPKISLEAHYYLNITPLMEAVSNENFEYVKFICNTIKEKYTKNNILHPNYKKYINQISTDGKSAVFYATLMNTKCDILNYLIEQGALLDIIDYDKKTIFHYARYACSEEVENFVLSLKKASPSHKLR